MLQDHRSHDVVDVQQMKDAEQANEEHEEKPNQTYGNNLDEIIRKLEESTDKMIQGVQDDLDEICGQLTGQIQNAPNDATMTPRRHVDASLPEPSEENLATLAHEILGVEYATQPSSLQPLMIRVEGIV